LHALTFILCNNNHEEVARNIIKPSDPRIHAFSWAIHEFAGSAAIAAANDTHQASGSDACGFVGIGTSGAE
jgi:hypothetical protein